jgi:hypothetical protein
MPREPNVASTGQEGDLPSGGRMRVSRGRQVLVGVAFSAPALAAGVGLVLAPSLSGLLVLACFVGVAAAAVRAEGARQRSRALLASEGFTSAHARSQWQVVLWLLLGVGCFVAAGMIAALSG